MQTALMHHHYLSSSDQRALKLWEDALRSWSKFAGWRGLHAHLWLGHVAALGSLVSVLDRRGRSLTRVDGIEHADNLGGAFASVYYSLSKIAPRNLAESFLSRSTLYVEHGLNSVERPFRSGLYAIRGSINLRRGDAKLAIEDYRRACDLAEAHGHGEQRIGELYAELGWAELRLGQFSAGRSHIEQGVSAMDDAGAGPGFRVRGKRKLAVARASKFALRGAYQSALSARDPIQEHGLFDQMDITIRTADRIQRLIDSIKLTR